MRAGLSEKLIFHIEVNGTSIYVPYQLTVETNMEENLPD